MRNIRTVSERQQTFHHTTVHRRKKRRIIIAAVGVLLVFVLIEFGIAFDRITLTESDRRSREVKAEYPSPLANTTWQMDHYYLAPGIKLPADAKLGTINLIGIVPLLSFSDDGKLVGGLTQGTYKTRDDRISIENVSRFGLSSPPLSILYTRTHSHMLKNVTHYFIEGSQLILKDEYGIVYIYKQTDYCDTPICL